MMTFQEPEEMNPVEFIRYWGLTYEVGACWLGVSLRAVEDWFGKARRNPRRSVRIRAAELHQSWLASGCPLNKVA